MSIKIEESNVEKIIKVGQEAQAVPATMEAVMAITAIAKMSLVGRCLRYAHAKKRVVENGWMPDKLEDLFLHRSGRSIAHLMAERGVWFTTPEVLGYGLPGGQTVKEAMIQREEDLKRSIPR